MMTANWTRLADGAWGVRVHGHVGAGVEIQVSKRDGSSSIERVERVLWMGIAKDGCAATLVQIARRSQSSSSAPRTTCVSCGESLDRWERQHSIRRCSDCRDGGSHAHGGRSYYDRHGNFVLGDDD